MPHLFVYLIIISFIFAIWDTYWVSSFIWKFEIKSTIHNDSVATREKLIQRILYSQSFLSHKDEELSISIDHQLIEPRARIKGRHIMLSSHIVRDTEFLKLFVHEFAHFVDIFILKNIWGKDISHEFYKMSWQDPKTKRAWQKQVNFVSGYAATNQYEDFAESYVFYIFHNRAFQERALRDDIVRQKYLFFQAYVFPDGAFVDTDFSLGRIPSYTWDTTRLPISLQKYLYSLY